MSHNKEDVKIGDALGSSLNSIQSDADSTAKLRSALKRCKKYGGVGDRQLLMSGLKDEDLIRAQAVASLLNETNTMCYFANLEKVSYGTSDYPSDSPSDSKDGNYRFTRVLTERGTDSTIADCETHDRKVRLATIEVDEYDLLGVDFSKAEEHGGPVDNKFGSYNEATREHTLSVGLTILLIN